MSIRLPRAAPTRWVGPVLVTILAGGLVAAAVGAWRPGLLVVGSALLAAAGLRLTFPTLPFGTLAVRAGWLDAGVMLVAGLVLVVASLALP